MPVSRQPSREKAASASIQGALPLRLIAARGGVGIELSEQRPFGPLVLAELSWTLPGLSFPLDLSGGVREFRHRRGEVQHAVLRLEPELLGKWLTGRLNQALGGLSAPVSVWARPAGFGVGLVGQEGALAFEMLWAPAGSEGRWVVHRPRTAGSLRGPAVAHAFNVLDAVVGRLGRRVGRVVEVGAVVSELCRAFLPPLGVRVPSASAVQFGGLTVRDEHLVVESGLSAGAPEVDALCLSALEFAELVTAADAHLAAGEVDEARAAYVAALERAPRHPELCQTIAAIDKDFEERSEAALGLMVEALPATAYGLVGAELLSQVGDEEGAAIAIERQATGEAYAPLAALLWQRLSELSEKTGDRVAALDRAVAVCPSLLAPRWARFELRLELSDLNGAVADAEHLEASTKGSREKHAVMVQAAARMQALGFPRSGRKLFERALRYLPKDAAATLGLARCFLDTDGGQARALVLLRRAAELVEETDEVYAEVQLELGKLLALGGHDLPQAINRVRRVHGRGPLLIEARALEARWRAQLGDLPGAAVAYGRLGDAVQLSTDRGAEAASYLLEGVRFCREGLDLRGAERYLALALELAPNHPEVRAGYREVVALLTRTTHGEGEAPAEPTLSDRANLLPVSSKPPEPSVHSEPVAGAEAGAAVTASTDVKASDPIEQEAMADALLAQLVAGAGLNDSDFATLEQGLSAAGREQELHALMWARYEDASAAEQAELQPRLRGLLERLALTARAQGRGADAELYEMQGRALGD